MKLELFIPGKPMAKQSTKFMRMGNYVRAYQPKKVENYQAYLKYMFADYMHSHRLKMIPKGVPVYLRVIFYYKWPASYSKRKREQCMGFKTTRPDGDNLQKPLKDAMNGVVYHDDSQVADESTVRRFTDSDEGILIFVSTIEKESEL